MGNGFRGKELRLGWELVLSQVTAKLSSPESV